MSEVWNHFYMAPNGLSVNCNHCGKFMKRSDSSTKSMWGHLKAFHSELVGEETFRLKRTRRMRGNGNNGDNNNCSENVKKQVKTKVSTQKRAKIDNLENNTKRQNGSLSSCNSSNINSENSSSGEECEEEILQNKNSGFESCSSRSDSPLMNADGKRQIIKKEENEKCSKQEDCSLELLKQQTKMGLSSALSIQTILKLENEDFVKVEENEEGINGSLVDGIKCPQNVLKVEEKTDQKLEVF